MLKIQYIYNSGFTLETEDLFLVFDVYTKDISLPEDKEIYYIISHGHKDHFSPRIFKEKEKAIYILSTDIKETYELEFPENTHWVSPHESLNLGSLKVETYSSTDEGVSFYLKCKDLVIYFAGDHNWWAWEDQGEEKEIEREKNFKSEIDPLKEKERIDIAFIPVDPRLEKNTFKAVDYIISTLKTKNIFPMHFREDFSIKTELEKRSTKETKIHTISQELEEFELEIE